MLLLWISVSRDRVGVGNLVVTGRVKAHDDEGKEELGEPEDVHRVEPHG